MRPAVAMAIKTELAAWREGINVEDKRNRIFSNDTDKKKSVSSWPILNGLNQYWADTDPG